MRDHPTSPAEVVHGRLHKYRSVVSCIASMSVACSPCLVPVSAMPLRFIATLVAVTILANLYDLFMHPPVDEVRSWPAYAVCLANGFWLVHRTKPPVVRADRDCQYLLVMGPPAIVVACVCLGLFWLDWSPWPFAVEHVLKVTTLVFAITLLGNAAASVWRLLGGTGLDPMNHPAAARSPADFWRRWNRPAQLFFAQHVYQHCGGNRHPLRATLATFIVGGLVHEYVFGIATGRVQGCQLLFFVIQGMAVTVTLRFRPRRWLQPFSILATIAFNLVTSVLFFQSVQALFPFYSPRG